MPIEPSSCLAGQRLLHCLQAPPGCALAAAGLRCPSDRLATVGPARPARSSGVPRRLVRNQVPAGPPPAPTEAAEAAPPPEAPGGTLAAFNQVCAPGGPGTAELFDRAVSLQKSDGSRCRSFHEVFVADRPLALALDQAAQRVQAALGGLYVGKLDCLRSTDRVRSARSATD